MRVWWCKSSDEEIVGKECYCCRNVIHKSQSEMGFRMEPLLDQSPLLCYFEASNSNTNAMKKLSAESLLQEIV